MIKKLLGAILALTPVLGLAQVAPAAKGGDLALSVGAEYSSFKPDFGSIRLQGMGAFFDLDHLVFRNLGVEAEGRWLRFNQPAGETEDNYLAGPRYRFIRYHRLSGYAKFLLGSGSITYPNDLGSGSYFAYALGGTAEYRLNRRWSLRGDYEYERWPSAPGTVFEYAYGWNSHGLTPNGFSIGASYRIF